MAWQAGEAALEVGVLGFCHQHAPTLTFLTSPHHTHTQDRQSHTYKHSSLLAGNDIHTVRTSHARHQPCRARFANSFNEEIANMAIAAATSILSLAPLALEAVEGSLTPTPSVVMSFYFYDPRYNDDTSHFGTSFAIQTRSFF